MVIRFTTRRTLKSRTSLFQRRKSPEEKRGSRFISRTSANRHASSTCSAKHPMGGESGIFATTTAHRSKKFFKANSDLCQLLASFSACLNSCQIAIDAARQTPAARKVESTNMKKSPDTTDGSLT